MLRVKKGSCVRLYIVNLNDSELLLFKVEVQKGHARGFDIHCFLDCFKLCELVEELRRKKV